MRYLAALWLLFDFIWPFITALLLLAMIESLLAWAIWVLSL